MNKRLHIDEEAARCLLCAIRALRFENPYQVDFDILRRLKQDFRSRKYSVLQSSTPTAYLTSIFG